ncbi:MAG TPA: tryptophan 2,3-dioxygenase family protein, partial [Nocardioides sp.]|nr:tryptophan 2,3-dioxygenase family protein [Nocardioides sp.]
MGDSTNRRDLEDGIQRDFSRSMSYGDYLRLDTLLAAQVPRSDPPQHDELLFIVQHQTSELWMKLLIHELRSARTLLRSDDLSPALKRMARIKHIQHTLTDQWSVLATLTPSEYAEIRPFLATSSGFQSAQYREVEFLLGNKNADMVKVFSHDEGARAALDELLHEPSLYDEFLAYLARQGYAVPARLLDRDWSQPYTTDADLVDVFAGVYAAPAEHWG